MALFGIKKETQAAQEPTPDMAAVNEALKANGIDVMAEKRRKEETDEQKRRHAEAMAAMDKREEERERLAEKAAPELVDNGHLIVTIDGARVKDANVPCPNCGTSLHEAKARAIYRAGLYAEASDKMDLVKWGNLKRLTWFSDGEECAKCGSYHTVLLQVVI